MSNEETKLKAFGLYKAHCLEHKPENFNYAQVAEQLDCKPAQVRKWIKEYQDLDKDASVANLVNIDEAMLDKVAKELDEDIEGAEKHELFVNPVTGAVEVKLPGQPKDSGRAQKITAFKDNVKGLQLLDQEVRAAAGIVVEEIMKYAQIEELSAKDLASLSSALTNIQNAFFNKPVTQVQVNNISGEEGTTLLASLRDRLKP